LCVFPLLCAATVRFTKVDGLSLERVNGSTLLDGYQYTVGINLATSFQTDVMLRPLVRVMLQVSLLRKPHFGAAFFDQNFFLLHLKSNCRIDL
jgi:hypothetical protein